MSKVCADCKPTCRYCGEIVSDDCMVDYLGPVCDKCCDALNQDGLSLIGNPYPGLHDEWSN